MKYLTLSLVLFLLNTVFCVEWKHSAILDNNFLVLWTPGDKEVTFEIQVKTLGYVGLGFKKEDGREGADMVIGWVDNNGQVHLQVAGRYKGSNLAAFNDHGLEYNPRGKTGLPEVGNSTFLAEEEKVRSFDGKDRRVISRRVIFGCDCTRRQITPVTDRET
ncbi:hypothetical protein M0802_006439 [Mischocyttarus mexicanus]|nr:hypothetical protein M0802_006439 [Mischocyttarus mexicanus]